MLLRLTLVVLASLAASTAGLAQSGESYEVPRTAHGHPDFQGVWATEFLTMVERPPGGEHLVVSSEQAAALAAALRSGIPDVVDPQAQWDGVSQLLMVKGEYRTSLIIEPEDGKMPFTQAGADLVARMLHRKRVHVRPSGTAAVGGALHGELRVPAHACAPRVSSRIKSFKQGRPRRHRRRKSPVGVRMIHLAGAAPT